MYRLQSRRRLKPPNIPVFVENPESSSTELNHARRVFNTIDCIWATSEDIIQIERGRDKGKNYFPNREPVLVDSHCSTDFRNVYPPLHWTQCLPSVTHHPSILDHRPTSSWPARIQSIINHARGCNYSTIGTFDFGWSSPCIELAKQYRTSSWTKVERATSCDKRMPVALKVVQSFAFGSDSNFMIKSNFHSLGPE